MRKAAKTQKDQVSRKKKTSTRRKSVLQKKSVDRIIREMIEDNDGLFRDLADA